MQKVSGAPSGQTFVPRAPAARMVDVELQRRPRLQRALLHRADMDPEIAGLLVGRGASDSVKS